jgi:hypothetical protein
MDTNTLIDVVATIDARINVLKQVIEDYNPETAHAQVFELQALSTHFQKAIDANVAAMESNTGE